MCRHLHFNLESKPSKFKFNELHYNIFDLYLQRKKSSAEFTADNIDNTAPIKKILDDLQHKNSQAFSFYCKTLRQRRTNKENHYNYHFAVTGHPLNAFTEEWDGGLNSTYFETFTYKSLLPKIISEIKNIDKVDPVTTYMKLKSDWNRDCRNLRLSASKYTNYFQ